MCCARASAKNKRGKKKRRTALEPGAYPPAPAKSTLGRILKYGEKIYGLCSGLRAVKDGRVKPRVPAGWATLGYLMLMLARLGRLNALEQRKAPALWVKWLGGPLPRAHRLDRLSFFQTPIQTFRGPLEREKPRQNAKKTPPESALP